MFDFKSFSKGFAAKLGCAVTISVLVSACSSQTAMIDEAQIPPAINEPTPEPQAPAQYFSQDSTPAPAARKTVKNSVKRHKKNRVARHKVKKHKAAAVASVSKAELNGPPPPSAPAFAAETAPAISDTAPPSMQDVQIPAPPEIAAFDQTADSQATDFWAIWLAGVIVSSGGLLWFALRRTGARKGKGRLIFNT